jgi:hypothetical protein
MLQTPGTKPAFLVPGSESGVTAQACHEFLPLLR